MNKYVSSEFLDASRFPVLKEKFDFIVNENRLTPAVAWQYGCSDFDYLLNRAKNLGAIWDGSWWVFPDTESYHSFFQFPTKKDYLTSCPRIEEGEECGSHTITLHTVGDGAYTLPTDLRFIQHFKKYYWIEADANDGDWETAPIVHTDCKTLRKIFEAKGATVEAFPAVIKPVRIRVERWLVRIICDPGTDPSHLLLRLNDGPVWHWEGEYPYGVRVATPWNGTFVTTRKEWGTRWVQLLQQLGIPWEGDDPEVIPLREGLKFDWSSLPGWTRPAQNGFNLHPYQREGVEFVAASGGRSLIGDEMGTGKTAQAIVSAVGMEAKRILVVMPVNARLVWGREILGWAGEGQKVQHITSGNQTIDPGARWVIVTYDLLITRARQFIVTSVRDKKIVV